ncbi:MAG: hypothetical protein H0V56_01665 [Chthoniobacterales bacterium]|nr:hypothetical protein [Chthoniobacterales bacterium]
MNADSVLQAKPGENEPVGILLHRDGVVLDLDEETAAIFGSSRLELIGKLLVDLVVGEPPAKVFSREGEPVPIEILRSGERK